MDYQKKSNYINKDEIIILPKYCLKSEYDSI